MLPRLPLRWESGSLSETPLLATLQQSAGWQGAFDCTRVQEMGYELAWKIRSVGVGAAAPSERSRRCGPRF